MNEDENQNENQNEDENEDEKWVLNYRKRVKKY